ncbi:Uncharacterised protein [[Pasteurella] mairii]|uniref:Uncharacterized protein n=1 Tax=[Pasteurella] mairii TaxID=757 RepID=A0A379B3C8_9PAST|nr:Uncharacterised protein [[Pasteurella] mairii]
MTAENLNIESLQDTAKYADKQGSVSGQVTVGYGFSAGGSYSRSKVKSNYASVKTQAGILAGDGGYDVNVDNKVHLTGGVILSSAEKNKNSLSAQTFSFEDIQNHSDAEASASGFGMGLSVGRDQTSEEDKQQNRVYRDEREQNGETFDKANPNKQHSSPIKFGLGENDVHSTDFYALAKIGAVNLLSNESKSESSSSITSSIISEGNFNIQDKDGQNNINRIKKGTIEETNSLEQKDYQSLQKEVEIDSSIKKAFYTNVAGLTDEAYRTMFIAEHRMMGFVTDKNGKSIPDEKLINKLKDEALVDLNVAEMSEDEINTTVLKYIEQEISKGRNIYQLYELSDQQRAKLKTTKFINLETGEYIDKVVVGFNGIFNQLQNAAKYAVQNYVSDAENNRLYQNTYFVHFPKANNTVSELLVAGYQKYLEGHSGLFGLTNSSIQARGLMEQYGQSGLFIGAHSRGTLTVSNALAALSSDINLQGTTMKMLGPAANVENTDRIFNKLSGHHIFVDNDGNDIVGTLVGFNPSTYTINTNNYGWGKLLVDSFWGDASPHNCGGLGNAYCVQQGYRNFERMAPSISVKDLEK